MDTSIKNIARAALLTSLMFSAASSFASGVFKCVDTHGNTTFSFTSCPSVAAPVVSATASVTQEENKTSRKVQLARLDASIMSLREELETLKHEYESSLVNQYASERTDDLTHHFDLQTSELFAELARLQEEKSRVFRR